MLEPLVEAAVEAGVTPGGVLVAGDGMRDVVSIAFGSTGRHADRSEVTVDTIYDIASLTKPIATAAVLMKLCGSGEAHLDDPVDGLDGVRALHLVGHAAGFPDHVKFYERLWAGDRAGRDTSRAALFEMARQVEPVYPVGAKTIYSDVGYILLGQHLERIGGRRLDELSRDLITGPLGMSATGFVDLELLARPSGIVAPTEHCEKRGLLIGEVHDENAHAAGGICGHAGLFSTGPDVATFARAICAAIRGEPSPWPTEIVRHFLSTTAAPNTTWRLGWDTPSAPGVTHAGDLWPRSGCGHLGFTGCSMWLDPTAGRYVVLLTNRVHPDRPADSSGIKQLRRDIMDAVVREVYAD